MLTAVDAALMVIDAGKGVETQTRKLFEVCRSAGHSDLHVHEQVRPADAKPAGPPGRAGKRPRAAILARRLAARKRPGVPGGVRPAHPPGPPVRARARRGLPGAGPGRLARRPGCQGKALRVGARRGERADRHAGRGRPRLRPGRRARRAPDAGLFRQRRQQLRHPAPPGRLPPRLRAAAGAPVRGTGGPAQVHPGRSPGLFGIHLQDPGEHGPEAPRPDRLPAGLLGEVRARHERPAPAHGKKRAAVLLAQALRPGKGHGRRGLAGRRHRPGRPRFVRDRRHA